MSIPNGLRCIYICPFEGAGGTQDYTFMLAKKMLACNPTVLAMPFDLEQHHFKKEFEDLGGETLFLPNSLCTSISARNYLVRYLAGRELSRLVKSKSWPKKNERLLLHTNIAAQTFASFLLHSGKSTIGINTFHDFGQLNKRSVSFIANTISLLLTQKKRTAFIVPSHAIANEFFTKVSAFVKNKTFVVHTGIDPLELGPTKQINQILKFGTIGRVAHSKAWDIWLSAISLHLKKNPLDKFEWYGGGVDLQTARKVAEVSLLKSNVHFYGFIDDTLSALDAIDIFVLSSRWEGGCLPRSVLQAMFRGVPCILPRLPSILEAIDGAMDCCILYDPYDPTSLSKAFEYAKNNPKKIDILKSRAQTLVTKNHTADAEFSATVKIYCQLIENSSDS